MSVEPLIGLEAAFGELGQLYVVAKSYGPLRESAERELLAPASTLAARLRDALRCGDLEPALIDDTARQVAELRSEWRQRLEQLRHGSLYQRCLRAWSSNAAADLVALLPELLADIAPGAPAPFLYYEVSPAAPRHSARPFLSPEACAVKIAAYRDEGISPEVDGAQWWDEELAWVELAREPEALETPVALRFDTASIPLPLFTMSGSAVSRAYGRVLKAPFEVFLQEDVGDEWWLAFDESYAEWRAALVEQLSQRAIAVVR